MMTKAGGCSQTEDGGKFKATMQSPDPKDYLTIMGKTGAAILNRLVAPKNGDLSRGAARSILRLDFPEADHARMAELSVKAQAGKLTPADQAELEEYLRVADFLAVLQSKARRSLKRVGRAS